VAYVPCPEKQTSHNSKPFLHAEPFSVIRTGDFNKVPWIVGSTSQEMAEVVACEYWALACGRTRLKCDGTRTESRFGLSAQRTSPFKLAGSGASVQPTTGSRGVCISSSNAGYTMFRGSVKSTGYPLHSHICPSLPLPCVTVCHHISTGVYIFVQCCKPNWGNLTVVLLKIEVSWDVTLRPFVHSYWLLGSS